MVQQLYGWRRMSMPMHILIVEDYPDFLQLVRLVLENEGYCVSTACSAEEAMDLLEQKTPDLMICDLDLPGKSGLALIRQLRVMYPLPAISMSGSCQYEDGRAARAAGYSAHLAKPFDLSALLPLVQSLVAGRDLPRSFEQPTA
jgi:CheY-like chemotaxis protein